MKAREEMPLLRCALGPTGRPFGDGLHSVTASGTDGRKAVITRNWDMAGSTLKKPIRGRKMGVGAKAYVSGVPVAFIELIALQLRMIPVRTIVDARITLIKSGFNVSVDDLSTHHLAGGDVIMVTAGLLKAKEKNSDLSFNQACALDLQDKGILKKED